MSDILSNYTSEFFWPSKLLIYAKFQVLEYLLFKARVVIRYNIKKNSNNTTQCYDIKDILFLLNDKLGGLWPLK